MEGIRQTNLFITKSKFENMLILTLGIGMTVYTFRIEKNT